MKKKGLERQYAEHVQEQNVERYVDALRGLLADDRNLFKTLHRITHLNNTQAALMLESMAPAERNQVLVWLIPAARIGLAQATFLMEDKYS